MGLDDTIHIQQEGNSSEGRYFTPVKGASRQAELVWIADSDSEGPIHRAVHTFVPPEARGQGIAELLVKALIADARKEGFRIAPDCAYVASYFRRHSDLADLADLAA